MCVKLFRLRINCCQIQQNLILIKQCTHVNTYPYQHIHSPYSVLVYIGVHDGIGDTSKTCFCSVSVVDYACGVCAIKVMIASCCCCFHGITCVDFAIAGVVDGSIDGVVRIVMCFRLDNRIYATTCNNDVCIASIGTVGCDFDVAGGVRFDAGVDALCSSIVFLFFWLSSHVFMVLKKCGER
jgi:hypothetical protein